jgi:hypothetical protein
MPKVCAFAVLVSCACACHRASDATPSRHDTAGSATAQARATALAAPAPPPSASASTTASTPADAATADLKARIGDFFNQYKDGSDFEFLRRWCASPLERFVSMRNADVGAVIASARQFFHDKHEVKYAADLAALRARVDGDTTVASLPVTMSWGMPPSWGTEGVREDMLADGVLYAGLVLQETTVDVELAFAKDGRITRYVEGTVHRGKLRRSGDFDGCDEVEKGGVVQAALPMGTVVLDLGQTYYLWVSVKGPEVARLVRFNGKDVWVNDQRYYSVPNPAGGSSAGGGPCLEVVP